MKSSSRFLALMIPALIGLQSEGCISAARPSADLERMLLDARTEQQRQAELIKQLEGRVMFAEDTARNARAALVSRPAAHTVSITEENSSPNTGTVAATNPAEPATRVGPAPRTVPVARRATSDATVTPPATTADDAPRPMLRLDGRSRPSPTSLLSTQPFMPSSSGLERLPVVPLPDGRAIPAARTPVATDDMPSTPGGNDLASLIQMTQQMALPTAPLDMGPSAIVPSVAAIPRRRRRVVQQVPTWNGDMPAGAAGVLDTEALPAYERALADARTGRCENALGAFSTFLQRWPEHPHADNAMYWRAECLVASGNRAGAIRELNGLLHRYPTGNKVPDALLKLSQIYRRAGDLQTAQGFQQRLLTEHPSSDAAARMRDSL